MAGIEGSAEAERPRGAVDGVTVHGFCEVTLQVRDLDGAARFYSTAFGLREISRESDRVWLAVGERARLGLWSPGLKEFGTRGACTCTSRSPSRATPSTRSPSASAMPAGWCGGLIDTRAVTARST